MSSHIDGIVINNQMKGCRELYQSSRYWFLLPTNSDFLYELPSEGVESTNPYRRRMDYSGDARGYKPADYTVVPRIGQTLKGVDLLISRENKRSCTET